MLVSHNRFWTLGKFVWIFLSCTKVIKNYFLHFIIIDLNCKAQLRCRKLVSFSSWWKSFFLPLWSDKSFYNILRQKNVFLFMEKLQVIFYTYVFVSTLWNTIIHHHLHSNHYFMTSEKLQTTSYDHGTIQNCLYTIIYNNLIFK